MSQMQDRKRRRRPERVSMQDIFIRQYSEVFLLQPQSETMIRTALTTLHISTIRTQRIIWEAPVPAVISTSIMEMYCSFL